MNEETTSKFLVGFCEGVILFLIILVIYRLIRFVERLEIKFKRDLKKVFAKPIRLFQYISFWRTFNNPPDTKGVFHAIIEKEFVIPELTLRAYDVKLVLKAQEYFYLLVSKEVVKVSLAASAASRQKENAKAEMMTMKHFNKALKLAHFFNYATDKKTFLNFLLRNDSSASGKPEKSDRRHPEK